MQWNVRILASLLLCDWRHAGTLSTPVATPHFSFIIIILKGARRCGIPPRMLALDAAFRSAAKTQPSPS